MGGGGRRMHCACSAAENDGEGVGPARPFPVEVLLRNVARRPSVREISKPP